MVNVMNFVKVVLKSVLALYVVMQAQFFATGFATGFAGKALPEMAVPFIAITSVIAAPLMEETARRILKNSWVFSAMAAAWEALIFLTTIVNPVIMTILIAGKFGLHFGLNFVNARSFKTAVAIHFMNNFVLMKWIMPVITTKSVSEADFCVIACSLWALTIGVGLLLLGILNIQKKELCSVKE